MLMLAFFRRLQNLAEYAMLHDMLHSISLLWSAKFLVILQIDSRRASSKRGSEAGG
jgi:hypothetical protein